MQDQHDILSLLLEHKASLEKCDNNGRQPLHVAVAKAHLASTKFLFGEWVSG
jgi:ankyrin repeat protein